MSVQTAYKYTTEKGVAGSLYDQSPYAIDSLLNGETDDGKLLFGMGVVQGPNPGRDVAIPESAATLEEFEGVVMTGFTAEHDMKGEIGILARQTVGVLRYGRPWVRIVDGVTPAYGDQLYLIKKTSGFGLFTNAAGSSGDTLAVKGRFIGGKGTGNVAPVEIYNQSNV
jgi:hypothetical protein